MLVVWATEKWRRWKEVDRCPVCMRPPGTGKERKPSRTSARFSSRNLMGGGIIHSLI